MKKYYTTVITGGSSGIGSALCSYLLTTWPGMQIYNLDINDPDNFTLQNKNYHYIHTDIRDTNMLPEIPDVNFLVNNAGIQEGSAEEVIRTNLLGVINCTEKYALNNPDIKSVVNQASVSAHNGAEFPYYTASKGGVLSYTVHTAKQLAPKAVCNSISFGGVITPLNDPVIKDKKKWDKIMEQTPMKRWATAREAAIWIEFLLLKQQSMTGQDIIVDNGEMINHKFVW